MKKETAEKQQLKTRDIIIGLYCILSFCALACGADSEVKGVLILAGNLIISVVLVKIFKVDKKGGLL